jgi:hypothetical protein
MARSPTTARAVVRGYSLMTGWGEGLRSLPANARAAADGCRVLAVPTPACSDDRLRRATRECVLAVAAVEQALANAMMKHSDLMGPRIALVYASAAAYAATNWAFLTGDKENALYFPYTAPSAVPGEVTIQFGITGPYLSFLSGANAGIEALWQAATLLINDQCDRALILGVDTFLECKDLYASGRWLLSAPLVEAATCLILERHAALTEIGYSAGSCDDELVIVDTLLDSQVPTAAYLCLPTSRDGYRTARRLRERWPDLSILSVSDRVGTCLACTPLVGLLLSRTEEKLDNVLLISRWWDAWSMLRWPVAVDPIDNNSRGKES